jgi:chaperonin GroES
VKVTPLGNRALVKIVEQGETTTDGGIVLPDSVTTDEVLQRATVIAVGPGTPFQGASELLMEPMAVKAGDEVFISKYGGVELKVNGEQVKLVSENEIVATIED